MSEPAAGLRDMALRALLAQCSPGAAKGRLSIGIFHRVLPAPDPLFPGEVTRESFDAICGWLAAWFHILPLDEAVERLRVHSLPERALCITFDDGYADNHDIALPVLRSHGLCATFFIASGFLDGGRMWNDTIIESIRGCALPFLDIADLGLAGIERLELASAPARRAGIDRILTAAKYLDATTRQNVANRIAERAGTDLPDNLMLRSDQVKAMRQAGMQIGAHTVSHPILARLDARAAHDEIARSKADLEALLGEPVSLFAYPNGKPGRDFVPRDVAVAKALGFAAAVTTAPGAAHSDGDMPFQMPRFTPWDASAWRFGLRMVRNLFVKPTVA
jgi:peptidoglycan/xylan/chitin deacetylase (PgdA/CDA1 family)